jgi:putative oxidoreductase
MEKIDRSRLFVPAVAGLYEQLIPYAPTLIRIALGLILIPHGFAKLFQDDAIPASRNFVNFGWAYPLAWAYFIGATEFFGGLMLVLGLYTRAAAVAVLIQMSVISFAVLWPNWFWGKRGMEFTVLMGLVAISIIINGSGPLGLDRRLRKHF